MARARNLKPALFKNELLGTADAALTILFSGLWTLADREGRLEDRPLRIRAEVLPYRDGFDIEAGLKWLHDNKFIVRYVVEGLRYICIPKFVEHQNPHRNEPESLIPPPQSDSKSGRRTSAKGRSPSAKGRSETENVGSTPADSLLLTPDPLNLTADSLESSSGRAGDPPTSSGGIPAALDTPRFREAWDRWIAHRREIGHALKPTQSNSQLKKLAGEGEPAAVVRVERSIANGWRGLWFDDDGKKKQPSADQTRQDYADFLQGAKP